MRAAAIRRVLQLTRGDKQLTAKLLGVGKSSLYRRTRPTGRGNKHQKTRQWAEQRKLASRLKRKFQIKTLRQLREQAIRRVLKLTDDDRVLTARLLQIGKSSIYRRG